MIGHPHNCLLALIADQFNLVLHIQHCLSVLLARHIPHSRLYRPWEALVSVLTHMPKEYSLLSSPLYLLWSLPRPLSPPSRTAVQIMLSIVCTQVICLVIEVVEHSPLNAVCCATNRFTEMRVRDQIIEGRFREVLHDVVARNNELLDRSSTGNEGEGRLHVRCKPGHGAGSVSE